MIVWEEFSEVVDGVRVQGRRQVEVPGVLTEKEALISRAKEEAKQADIDRMNTLRDKAIEAFLTGDDVTPEDRSEYRTLRNRSSE